MQLLNTPHVRMAALIFFNAADQFEQARGIACPADETLGATGVRNAIREKARGYLADMGAWPPGCVRCQIIIDPDCTISEVRLPNATRRVA